LGEGWREGREGKLTKGEEEKNARKKMRRWEGNGNRRGMKGDGKGREGEVREEEGWKEKEMDGREGNCKVRKGEERV